MIGPSLPKDVMPGKELYVYVCVFGSERREREKKKKHNFKAGQQLRRGGGARRNAEREQKQDLCVNHREQHGMDTMWTHTGTERLVCLRLLFLHVGIKHPSGELDGSRTWLSSEYFCPGAILGK